VKMSWFLQLGRGNASNNALLHRAQVTGT